MIIFNILLWMLALGIALTAILWLAAVIWILYTLICDKDMRIPIEQEADHE